MKLSQKTIERSLKVAAESIATIVSSNRGDRKDSLHIDVSVFLDIMAAKILLPIVVSVTSALIADRLKKSRPLDALLKDLNGLAGSEVRKLDEAKKGDLINTAAAQLAQFGASREQARNLVDTVIRTIESGEDAKCGGPK
jgi:hypothetical protein